MFSPFWSGMNPSDHEALERSRRGGAEFHLLTLLQTVTIDFVTRWFPRLSTFVLGPAAFGFAIYLLATGKDVFLFRVRSEGSAAALVLPILMWLLLAFVLSTAFLLFTGGLERLDQPHPARNLSAARIWRLAGLPLVVLLSLCALTLLVRGARSAACDESRALAYAGALPAHRLARVFDDVRRVVPRSTGTLEWSRATQDLPAFADLQALAVQRLFLDVSQVVLKTCGRHPVRLMVYTDATEDPRIELHWQDGAGAQTRVLWKPAARRPAP